MRDSAGRRPSERERTSPSIAVSIAPADSTEVRRYGIIGGTLAAVDKLLKKLALDGVELHLVYEAGPCGFVLCRHLRAKGFHCDVVAPSLIPKKASDRVKTDRRDADQLARLYRAGELTAIHVPDQEDETLRDLVRARFSAMTDQRQARNRLKGFLLRQGFRYTGKSSWNDAHRRYLCGLVMPQAPQQIAFQEYIQAINDATDRLERLTRAVEDALPRQPGKELPAHTEWREVPASLSPARVAQGFSTRASLRLVEPGGQGTLRAHPGAAGLESAAPSTLNPQPPRCPCCDKPMFLIGRPARPPPFLRA